MMRRLIFISLMSLLLAVPTLADMKIKLYDSPGNGTTRGGEFIATLTSDSDPIGNYLATDSFGTFCVETDEFINYGTTYYVTLSDYAFEGGSNIPPGTMDPLDVKTAWIYTQWMNGTITHNDYWANIVQESIWYIEQESLGRRHQLVDDATTATANGAWTNLNVKVMNLWTTKNADGSYSGYAQDQLVMVPLPATFLLGLLGLGMGGWKLRKRKSV